MDAYDIKRKNWEDLDVSKEELQNLTECLKKEEFRKLLIEYAEEVTDPENRKIYEKEITQLEKERGVDVTFINPEPGYVIKTSINGDKKCFINISKSETVAKPSSQPFYKEGHRGLQWSIPYTLTPPRDDLDKKNVRCTVFDVVFHPDTLHLASKNARFRETVNGTAIDGVESNFKVKLDRKNCKFPKISFKGISQPAVIRKASDKPIEERLDIEPEIYQKLMASYDESRDRQLRKDEEKPQRSPLSTTYFKNRASKSEAEDSIYTTPKFLMKHQTNVELEEFENHKNAKLRSTVPRKLIIVVDLPLLKSSSDASLDVQERFVSVKSEKPAKYLLELPLPYFVDADNGNAKFDAKCKKLTITLPVVRGDIPLGDIREDIDVDNDRRSPLFDSKDETNAATSTTDHFNDSESNLITDSETPLIVELNQESAVNECGNTALRTSETIEPVVPFMNPNIKYSLPAFICNLYNNLLTITVNVKNVDPDSICHRTMDMNSGIHILLTSIGAGFFPVYYSLCIKINNDSVQPESLKVDPWDNNVVFTIALKNTGDLARYYVGLDEEFMEVKDLPTAATLKNKFNELMIGPESEFNKRVEVIEEGEAVVINIQSNQLDSDDEVEQDGMDISNRGKKEHSLGKSRSVSESSGDELPSGNSSTSSSKGILKSRRKQGFSRSVSESSIDDNVMIGSSIDLHYDSVQELNSESDCSSLKKTVRFNDVVSRQLYRSNSSILGQRKKNQRKLRNKKRTHERRVSESENSETDDRDKYKVSPKDTQEQQDVAENVKPIINRDKLSKHQKTANIEIKKSRNNGTNSSHKCKRSSETKENEVRSDIDKENAEDIVKTEFKNDLIFDLDM